MRKLLLSLGAIILMVFSVNAQNHRLCAADEVLDRQSQNPKIQSARKSIETHTRNFIKKGAVSTHRSGILNIPVIVHVIYNTSQQNISDAQIQSQIDVLTEDFRKLNADVNQTPAEFAPLASDIEIEFSLAQITRKQSSRTSWGTNDAMKSSSQGGVDVVNPSEYLNIWVCEIGGGILGYAQFPGGPASTDGVVISPQYFGSRDKQQSGQNFYLSAPFDKGRTGTHEVGHYLNLRHIWGDGNCNADDFVSDTPVAGGPNYGCPSYPSKSCNNNGGYTSDMFMNYMDYSDDACMSMFSAGQKARMDALFEPGGARETLGTTTGGCSLAAPSGLSSSNIGDNSFTLSWNAVSGATGYDVSVDGSVSTVSGTSTTITGLTAGTTYTTKVRANCSSGSGAYSSDLNVTTTGSNCNTGDVTLSLTLDNYPSETSWSLQKDGSTVASGSGYSTRGQTITEVFSYGDGNYSFTINDSYGDGICCGYGNGSYSLTDANNNVIVSGGNFGSTENTSYCIDGGGPAPDTQAPTAPGSLTASNETQTSIDLSWSASTDNVGVTDYDVFVDGSLDGSTTGTSYVVSGLSAGTTYSLSVRANDAAGNQSSASSISATTQSAGGGGADVLLQSYFESGWDGWTDGGSDCARYSGSRSYEGSYSIRLRDNSGSRSAMTASGYDLIDYDQVTIEFFFYANSMENGEDFWVRFNGGGGWQTVASYARGTDFNNNTFYTATVTLDASSYNFGSNSQFRFQCDASANGDQVYIDQVTITGISGSARSAGNSLTTLQSLRVDAEDNASELDGIQVYPNPMVDRVSITVDIDELSNVNLYVYDLQGKVVLKETYQQLEGLNELNLDVSGLEQGMYIIKISDDNGLNETQKLLKD